MDSTSQTNQTEETLVGLDLHPGMTVEVSTAENRLIFVGKVDSYQNEAVIIRDAKGDELPPVLYNRELKLRFFQKRNNLVLQGKVCGSTRSFWKVDRLKSVFAKEQRAFFRQRISTDCEGMCARRTAYGGTDKDAYPCRVLDVSAGGILVSLSRAEAYQVGDRLAVTGVRITPGEYAFDFNCRVRRVGEQELGVTRYGCQFESLSSKEQDRLLRAIFIVQREEIRRQKERDSM